VRGETATLEWNVKHADHISILPDMGTVEFQGSRRVSPETRAQYKLTAKGPGGEISVSAILDVTRPPVVEVTAAKIQEIEHQLKDVYFDYDRATLREDARLILSEDARVLVEVFAMTIGLRVHVEGHCDQRGSREYNLAMGDQRANTVMSFLIESGVPSDRLAR